MNQDILENRQNNSSLNIFIWTAFSIYFAINAFSQFIVSKTADLDQAEQLILSQSLKLGYSSQPPLYTYLTSILFSLTGPSLISLYLLKVILLSLLFASLIGIGKQFNFTTHQYLVSTIGFVFIPQFIWESQRDLTHSVLVTTIASFSLFQLVRTYKNPDKKNYILLGLLIGSGLLSKYNYVFLLFSLFLAVIFTKKYRTVLINKNAILVIIFLSIVVIPHTFWAIDNIEINRLYIEKFKIGGHRYIRNITESTLSFLSFVTPLCISSVLLFSGKDIKNRNYSKNENIRFMNNLLFITIITAFLFFLLTGADIKDRWLQPLLFYLPILIAMYASPIKKRIIIYTTVGIIIAVTISLGLILRITLAEKINHYSRHNLPYPDILNTIKSETEKPDVIFAETILLGGNTRLYFKDSQIIVPGYNNEPIIKEPIAALLICESDRCNKNGFNKWLKEKYNIDVNSLKFSKTTKNYYYSSNKKFSVYWSSFPIYSLNNKIYLSFHITK